MGCRLRIVLSFSFILFLMTGCASLSPTYIDDGAMVKNDEKNVAFNPVHFKVSESFKTSPPNCIAILPFRKNVSEEGSSNNERTRSILLELNDDVLEQLRWNLYSHLAPYSYRDVELESVNKAILKQGGSSLNYPALGSTLKCDALLLAEVIDYSTEHFGFYSQASVGVRMTLFKAKNNEVLWEGNHVAKSQGGSVPLTPVDIVVGIYSATENVSDEQLVRVEDDLFRRLLSTWNGTPESVGDSTEQQVVLAQAEEGNQPLTHSSPSQDELFPFHVSVQNLYLRSGPGKRFSPKGVLEQNETLAMLDQQNLPWVQIKMSDGRLGYVNSKYIASR